MTILLHEMAPKAVRRMANGPTELSSRPERSVVEGPAVSLPVLTHPLKPLRVHRLAGLNRGELKMDVIVETLNKVGFD